MPAPKTVGGPGDAGADAVLGGERRGRTESRTGSAEPQTKAQKKAASSKALEEDNKAAQTRPRGTVALAAQPPKKVMRISSVDHLPARVRNMLRVPSADGRLIGTYTDGPPPDHDFRCRRCGHAWKDWAALTDPSQEGAVRVSWGDYTWHACCGQEVCEYQATQSKDVVDYSKDSSLAQQQRRERDSKRFATQNAPRNTSQVQTGGATSSSSRDPSIAGARTVHIGSPDAASANPYADNVSPRQPMSITTELGNAESAGSHGGAYVEHPTVQEDPVVAERPRQVAIPTPDFSVPWTPLDSLRSGSSRARQAPKTIPARPQIAAKRGEVPRAPKRGFPPATAPRPTPLEANLTETQTATCDGRMATIKYHKPKNASYRPFWCRVCGRSWSERPLDAVSWHLDQIWCGDDCGLVEWTGVDPLPAPPPPPASSETRTVQTVKPIGIIDHRTRTEDVGGVKWMSRLDGADTALTTQGEVPVAGQGEDIEDTRGVGRKDRSSTPTTKAMPKSKGKGEPASSRSRSAREASAPAWPIAQGWEAGWSSQSKGQGKDKGKGSKGSSGGKGEAGKGYRSAGGWGSQWWDSGNWRW